MKGACYIGLVGWVALCSCDGAEEAEDLGTGAAAIEYGSTDFGAFTLEKKTAVGVTTANLGNCSGTLLRNNLVLTARHCVTSDGKVSGPVGSASNMRVMAGSMPGNVCPAGSCVGVSTIVSANFNPNDSSTTTTNSDAALLVLSAPLSVDGDSQNVFSALDPYPIASRAGVAGRIVGRPCSTPPAAGTPAPTHCPPNSARPAPPAPLQRQRAQPLHPLTQPPLPPAHRRPPTPPAHRRRSSPLSAESPPTLPRATQGTQRPVNSTTTQPPRAKNLGMTHKSSTGLPLEARPLWLTRARHASLRR